MNNKKMKVKSFLIKEILKPDRDCSKNYEYKSSQCGKLSIKNILNSVPKVNNSVSCYSLMTNPLLITHNGKCKTEENCSSSEEMVITCPISPIINTDCPTLQSLLKQDNNIALPKNTSDCFYLPDCYQLNDISEQPNISPDRSVSLGIVTSPPLATTISKTGSLLPTFWEDKLNTKSYPELLNMFQSHPDILSFIHEPSLKLCSKITSNVFTNVPLEKLICPNLYQCNSNISLDPKYRECSRYRDQNLFAKIQRDVDRKLWMSKYLNHLENLPKKVGYSTSHERSKQRSCKGQLMVLPFSFRLRERIPSLNCPEALTLKKCRRSRTVFTERQLNELEVRFGSQKYLSTSDRLDLADKLNLSQLQVKTWYQNRRMKWKKQVMEGGNETPTKPKGRPKKNSVPSLAELTSLESERRSIK